MIFGTHRWAYVSFVSFLVFTANNLSAAQNSLEIPQEVIDHYKYLYDLPVQILPDGSKKFHQARLFVRKGIYVLHLKGDAFEMAYQHGKLLYDEIHTGGALQKLSAFVDDTVANLYGPGTVITELITAYIHTNVVNKMYHYAFKNAPDAKAFYPAYGMSLATGMPYETIIRAAFSAEALMVLATKTQNGIFPTFLDRMQKAFRLGQVNIDSEPFSVTGRTSMQCTGFVHKGSNQNLIIGRNTDYPLNGYYDKYPTIIYFEPADGGQKYLSVTAAGLHNSGVTAINEAGIFLGSHTAPTQVVSELGYPVFFAAQKVMQQARTLQDVVNHFQSFRPASGWIYSVASVAEGRAASIELNNKNVAVRYMQGHTHIQTNHYLTKVMRTDYFSINTTIDEDSAARYNRVETLIANDELDVQDAFAILSDKVDPLDGKVKSFLNTVAVNDTVSSVVIDGKNRNLYVANGLAPASQTQFVEFPMVREFDPDQFMQEEYQVVDNDHFKTDGQTKHLAEAEKMYIAAKAAYEYDHDYKKAQKLLQEVTKIDAANARYYFMHALLSLKVEDHSAARVSLQTVLSMSQGSHLADLAHYYLGRSYAHFGENPMALEYFAKVVKRIGAHKRLQVAADTWYKKMERLGNSTQANLLKFQDLVILMQQADLQRY